MTSAPDLENALDAARDRGSPGLGAASGSTSQRRARRGGHDWYRRMRMATKRSASGAGPAIGPQVGVAIELRGVDLGPEQVGQLALGVPEGNELIEMDEDHRQLSQRS